MGLSNRDIKDLFPNNFLVRKAIRDLQIDLTKLQSQVLEEIELCTPPPKKLSANQSKIVIGRSSNPSPNTSRNSPVMQVMTMMESSNNRQSIQPRVINEEFNTINIPLCSILANPEDHNQKEIDSARVRIIRQCMDSLVCVCRDRPTEYEIIQVAKTLTTQYSVLRDDKMKPPRDNYRAVKKFLERRMYNTTPSRTNRGRKRKSDQVNEIDGKAEEEMVQEIGNLLETERESNETTNKDESQGHGNEKNKESQQNDSEEYKESQQNDSEENQEAALEDNEKAEQTVAEKENMSVEDADTDLRNCSKTELVEKVNPLLRLTIDYRNGIAERLPKSTRVDDMLEMYPVFKCTDTLINNLVLSVNVEKDDQLVTRSNLEKNLLKSAVKVLDYVFAKNLTTVNRKALKSEDQQILIAMAQLQGILNGKKERSSKSSLLPHMVHLVKKEELWQDIANQHKNISMPWIMYQRHGDKEIITLMIKNILITKASSAVEAVLSLFGVYYMAMMPYPPQSTGALLYLQSEVLKDVIHKEDKSILKKAKQLFEDFETETEDHDLFA